MSNTTATNTGRKHRKRITLDDSSSPVWDSEAEIGPMSAIPNVKRSIHALSNGKEERMDDPSTQKEGDSILLSCKSKNKHMTEDQTFPSETPKKKKSKKHPTPEIETDLFEENKTFKSPLNNHNEKLEDDVFSIPSLRKSKKKKSTTHWQEPFNEIDSDEVEVGEKVVEDTVYDVIECVEKEGIKNTTKEGISPLKKPKVTRPIHTLSEDEENIIDDPDSRSSSHKSKKRVNGNNEVIDNGIVENFVDTVVNHSNEVPNDAIESTEDESTSQTDNEDGIDKLESYEIPILHQRTNNQRQPSLSQIKELRAKGIPIKTGRFSEAENHIVKKNIRRFRKTHNFDRQTMKKFLGINSKSISKELRLMYKKRASELQLAYELGRGLPHRTRYSIYRRARVIVCQGQFGKMMRKDQDEKLLSLIKVCGRNFSKISTIMGIPAPKLYDRLRSMDRFKTEKKGRWSDSENKLLKEAVAKVLKINVDDVLNYHDNIPWHDVAVSVPKRTPIQCRKHWTVHFRWKVDECKNFTRADTLNVLDLIRKSGVKHEEEIDWGSIANELRDKISYYQIRKLWNRLKALVPGDTLYMELEDYLDFLDKYIEKYPVESIEEFVD